MTGRKSTRNARRKATATKQAQQQSQQAAAASQQSLPQQQQDDSVNSPPGNIKREQPPPPQVVKKILKAETDEARTLKTVFKSNPDSQMKEFIKKAAVKPAQQPKAPVLKTPAETHPPAVVQELLETDDDVADNLGKLFRTSKSYKNL